MKPNVFEYFMTPISLLGTGCLPEIIKYVTPMKFRKAFIVSDKFLVDSGLTCKLTDILQQAGIFYIIYDNVSPNPTVEQVEYGLKLYRDNGCDFLISFGGGSPHDCAKAIGLLATNGGKIQDYVGLNKASHPAAPLIAVNTTAGTGSELTRFCVITDTAQQRKMTITDWHVTPIIAVNDAELMLDMPPGLTAATGIDALTHAIEAYVSTNATPVTDCKALKAIELISRHLPTAVQDGHNRQAREMMVYAEYLAGIAFNNASLGYVHALAHQLGGKYNLPHGLANGMLLAFVTAFNLTAAPEKYADIAMAMGLTLPDRRPETIAAVLLGALRTLLDSVHVPCGIKTVKGFDPTDIPHLAASALQDVCALTNPRQGSAVELAEILQAAWSAQ
ncbi:iron-containing alcohol dehydrogenase [Azotosporobacter soli]|uniref:iron-containing alcohol dehydrogenase n=1 Tax=Azotosporobacter soli TaxID=3055040 RepID=UPI0031FEC332